jgi:hypothetical protein
LNKCVCVREREEEIRTAVEGVGLGVLVGLLGADVGDGVLDAGGLAAGGGQDGMKDVDEGG